MARTRRTVPKGELVVGNKRLKVRVYYDYHNKIHEAKLTKAQLRSLLNSIKKWMIMNKWVYEPNYDGLVAGKEKWRELSEDGKKWILEHDLKYAGSIYYLPEKDVVEVNLGRYGNLGTYYLKPVGVKIKLINS